MPVCIVKVSRNNAGFHPVRINEYLGNIALKSEARGKVASDLADKEIVLLARNKEHMTTCFAAPDEIF